MIGHHSRTVKTHRKLFYPPYALPNRVGFADSFTFTAIFWYHAPAS